MSSLLSPIEGVDSSSRVLRTSIFLKNSLNQSDGKVNDLLDCVVPIIELSINQLPAGQIVLPDLQTVIKDKFSFSMPTFAIEHVLMRLARSGRITFDNDQRSYYHSSEANSADEEEEEADKKISYIEKEIARYSSNQFGIDEPPFFSTWSDIIVYFMHPDAVDVSKSIKSLKGAIITDFDQVIRRISSNFILECESRDEKTAFNIILEMYGGILLGDFLQNIQSTGSTDNFKDLTVFYDTSILLRLIGCSGTALRNANMEMHRDLQSLGCKTEYLQHNESEVAVILDTVVARYDAHLPIFGETAEALLEPKLGIQIGTLKALQNGYPEALAELSIFPSKYSFQNTKTQNFFQIDEAKFESMLGVDTTRGYSEQNRAHDAQSLAVVMRLRQSSRSHDLSSAKYVFVTSNAHLARTARKYVQMDLGLPSRYIPPVLTHSQMTTAAWLSTEKKLVDSYISRELIGNCMSAQKLSKEWVESFVDMLKETSLDEEDKTFVYALRSIARDESLGNPAILKRLNPTEMLKAAKQAEAERTAHLNQRHQEEMAQQLALREHDTKEEVRTAQQISNLERSEIIANGLVKLVELLLVFPCVYVLVVGTGNFSISEPQSWPTPIMFVTVTILAVLDLFQFRPIARLMAPVRSWVSKKLYQLLYS